MLRCLTRRRAMIPLLVCLTFGVLAGGAFARAKLRVFHPRVGHALGLIPPINGQGELNAQPSENGVLTPVLYHGGQVMTGGVIVHTVFWAPSGFAFQGAPPGSLFGSYEQTIEQFFTDVAHDSGATSACSPSTVTTECNIFSTLTQFGQGTSPGGVQPGSYSIAYNPSTFNATSNPTGDVVIDTDPYPAPQDQCSSPQDTSTCVTDAQVQAEVDRLVQSTPGAPRGLHNLWFVFLPPDVDECILPGECGTNAFLGYHSLSNVGHGVTIYAVAVDPIVETGSVPPGADPNGNPDAELAADVAAHETNEAMTDPEGVGWMDPNGYEVGDKCEFGPQRGTPLGYGPDGSPYNQVIDGHDWLTQEIWSNDGDSENPVPSCVQGTTETHVGLPLPQVNLTQFSKTVTGNIGSATAGVGVTVSILRAAAGGNPVTVASASGTTSAGGAWSVTLKHAIGDDRDEIDVDYSGAGAPTPNHQVILTGNGGNPFTESGWTGWTDLDNGSALMNSDPMFGGGPTLTIAPCFQTGVESYTIGGAVGSQSPSDFCGTASDAADVPLSAPVGPSTAVTVSTNDNRAFQPLDAATPNPFGGLVDATVPVGEPDAVSLFLNPLPTFAPTGFSTCTADLGAQRVSCSGLVPGERYTLTNGRRRVAARADALGGLSRSIRVAGGDAVALSNGSRIVTMLHVARLRVRLIGNDAAVVAGGTCSPGEYWGGPLTKAPTNSAAGEPSALAGGAALTGEICPLNGVPRGLPASSLAQTDEASGGQTVTELARLKNSSPTDGEIVYGRFGALARATGGHPTIALTITHRGRVVFRARNVDRPRPVTVRGLRPGTYIAIWTIRDANGDARIVRTRFIEEL